MLERALQPALRVPEDYFGAGLGFRLAQTA